MFKPAKPGMFLLLAFLALAGAAFWGCSRQPGSSKKPARPPAGSLTFTRDIAPIIFNRCSGCHRPGQPAPFNLLSYEDVRKRAPQIAEVIAKRDMPPWLPEASYGQFLGDPSLTHEPI